MHIYILLCAFWGIFNMHTKNGLEMLQMILQQGSYDWPEV